MAEGSMRQRQAIRLTALITSRYNWQRDELSIGQVEIARLWSVDPRTVKREMAAFRALGWITVKRKGARGRVGVYGLNLGRLMEDTRPSWSRIGPDFAARVAPTEARESNVVPLRAVAAADSDGSLWSAAQAILHAEYAAEYAVWFSMLTEAGREGGRLTLLAPTRFHANYVTTHFRPTVLSVVRRADPTVSDVCIET